MNPDKSKAIQSILLKFGIWFAAILCLIFAIILVVAFIYAD